jgi:hypothetical protein
MLNFQRVYKRMGKRNEHINSRLWLSRFVKSSNQMGHGFQFAMWVIAGRFFSKDGKFWLEKYGEMLINFYEFWGTLFSDKPVLASMLWGSPEMFCTDMAINTQHHEPFRSHGGFGTTLASRILGPEEGQRVAIPSSRFCPITVASQWSLDPCPTC